MKVIDQVNCKDYPCADVRCECCLIPDVELEPKKVSVIMISESAPVNPNDYYYAGKSEFLHREKQAQDDIRRYCRSHGIYSMILSIME
jgi:hypothetical protein